MKNILVAINFEKNAERLVEEGYKLAKAFDSKVWILHVSEADPDDFLGLEAGPQFAQDKRVKKRKQNSVLIKKLAEELNEKGIESEGLLIEGPTSKTIRKKVADLNVDLVIAGHQKKNYFYQLFVGNKDKDLLDDLSVPVLVVPLSKK